MRSLLAAVVALAVAAACVALTSASAAPAKHGHHHHHHNKPKPGPRGPRGATGPAGPAGPAGSGALALTYVAAKTSPDGFDQDAAPHNFGYTQAYCPEEGQIATGGGVTADGASDSPDTSDLVYPVGSVEQAGGGWFAAVENRDDVAHSFTAWAVCTPGTVTQAKAKANAKTGPRGPRGPRGATGPQGPPGAAGTGQIALTYVTKQVAAKSGNTTGTATCPAGQHVTGGGVGSEATVGKQWLTDSAPTPDGTGWAVSMDNFGNQPAFTIHAICVPSTAHTVTFPKTASGRHAKRGPRGPRGRTGATGPQGPAGTSPPVATIAVTEKSATDIPAPAQAQTVGSAPACPAGQHVTGGGFITGSTGPNQLSVNSSLPENGSTWTVAVDNTSNAAQTFEVYAYCAPSEAASKR